MTKHTPGPWVVDEQVIRPQYSGFHIASVAESVIGAKEANARLLAASPELLKATRLACLVMAKGNGLSYKDRQEAHEVCMAAIAKAEE